MIGCRTIGITGYQNPVRDQPCVFPFVFKSKNYTTCTADGDKDNVPWCATSNSYNWENEFKWGVCTNKCPGGGT